MSYFARSETRPRWHWHVFVLSPDGGGGLSSEEEKHLHQVRPVVPQVSPEFVPGEWEVLPAADGHTHQLEPLSGKGLEPENKKAQEVYSECLRLFQAEIENETECRKDAQEAEDFYRGKQWKDGDRRQLKKDKRACLTINKCEALVDSVSGSMRQNQMDWKCRPIEGSDQASADLATMVLKAIATWNNFPEEETEVCDDQIISGRGCFHLFPEKTPNGGNQLTLEWWPNTDVYLGQHMRKDLRDCEHMSKARWFSSAEVRYLYPEKAGSLPTTWTGPEDFAGGEIVKPNPGQAYSSDRMSPDTRNMTASLMMDNASKSLRVVEQWRREYRKTPVITDAEGVVSSWSRWDADEVSRAKRIPGITVDWVMRQQMRKTTFTAGTILEDEYPDQPEGVEFPITPVFGHFRRGKWWGKLESAKDPQRDLNKRFSQTHDVFNKMAGYGWFTSRDMFSTDEEFERFKQVSSQSGWVVELQDATRKPVREDGVKVPAELITGIQTARDTFDEVTAWSTKWINAGADMSGDAVAERQRSALLPNEYLFSNLRGAKRRLGRSILAWVQHLFTAEQIARLVMSSDAWQGGKIGQQTVEEFTFEDIVRMLSTKDLTKFDVEVSEDTWSPTVRMSNFRMWSKIPNTPMEMLVEMSDLPNKKRFTELLTAQQQAAKAEQDRKMQMELGKTVIAKGADPAAVMNPGGQK